MSKKYKRIISSLICTVILILSVSVCSATGSQYVLNELDKMNITLPDTMTAATRSSSQSDEFFSAFGLDYDTVMKNFKDGNIYLQGMNKDSLLTLTVTMTESSESKEITNYTLLSQDKLSEVEQNFLSQSEYTSCTPDEAADGKAVWLLFNTNVNTNGNNIQAYQAHTVYDGMSINITLQRNDKNVTASDFTIFSGIVSSVSFGVENSNGFLLPIVLIGGGVVLAVLLVILIIAIKRASKKRKKKQNNKILSELASKYNLDDGAKKIHRRGIKVNDNSVEHSNIIDINNSDKNNKAESSEYIDEEMFAGSLEREMRSKYFDVSQTDAKGEADKNVSNSISDEEIDAIINSARAYETDENKVVYTEGQDVSKSRFENKSFKTNAESEETDDVLNAADTDLSVPVDTNAKIVDDEEELDLTEDGLTELDEFNNDEELVRSEAKKTKFFDSDDFFEEAPKRAVSVLSYDEISEAEDFDVINEIENKAEKIKNGADEQEDVDMGAPIGEQLKKIGEGIKYFGVHCGYFATNVARMIKRKRTAAKRKKLEQERRERARLNAEKKRRQQKAAESGSLVQVHSRTDRRPQQGKNTQKNYTRTNRTSDVQNNRKPRR